MVTSTHQNKLSGNAYWAGYLRELRGRGNQGGERLGDSNPGIRKQMKRQANRALRYQPIELEVL